jgi:hypothetical protein
MGYCVHSTYINDKILENISAMVKTINLEVNILH